MGSPEDSGSCAPFRCEVSYVDDRAVVVPRGELDLATAPVVLQEARAALARPVARIVVDLRGTPFMDSSGIHALNTIRREAADRGTEVSLTSVPPQPRMVLELTGLAEPFGLAPVADGTPPGARGGTAA